MTPPPPPSKTTDLVNDFDDLNIFPSNNPNSSPSSNVIKHFTRPSSNSNSNSSLSYSSVSSANLSSSGSSSAIIGDDFTVTSRIMNTSSGFGSGSSPQALNRRSREDGGNYNYNHRQHNVRRLSNPSNNYTYNNKSHNHKERYVFSNFRFLVKGDSSFPKSIDETFDWLAIEMVLVPEIENVLCPICLDVPCVARFTRCGHIYCLPCVLQYFQSSSPPNTLGNNWRTCPVCAEPLHLKQLRPVKFCPATEPKEGDILHSILIQKSVGSLQPNLPEFSNDTLESISPFQRIIPITKQFVITQIINPELNFLRNELKRRKSFGEDSLELSFYEAASKILEEQKKSEVINSEIENESEFKKNVNIISSTSTSTNIISSTNTNTSTSTSTSTSTGEYYFHQSRDGLNVFLHPICMKILKTHFNTFPDIPKELSLPILQLDRVIVDVNNRKRFKYLDHLSSGTQIILAEVDLKSIVSPEILNLHQKELLSRQNARNQKVISENRSNKKENSILEEWKRMEDDYYSTNSAAMDIKVPETVNLDNLNDEASFPLPSSFNSPQNLNSSFNNNPISTFTSPVAVPKIVKKSFKTSSNSFADAAVSPPSYSALAHSLNSPFTYNSNLSPEFTATTTTDSNLCNVTGNNNNNNSPSGNASQGGKKKFVLFSNGLMNFKR